MDDRNRASNWARSAPDTIGSALNKELDRDVDMERREFVASLVAGGCAGMCVDLTLFPLDTIKTRLQSQQGFYKAGGFRGIYAGVPSAAVGSFPNAAAFFVTYDCTKSLLGAGGPLAAPHVAPVAHMLAASLGEICLRLSDFTDHYAELASGGGRVVLAGGSELQLGASSGPSLLPVDLPSSGPQTLPIESVGFRPVTSGGTVSSIHPIRITVEYRF
ncbi:S-adenosylmethionine mitochondrial carrier protein [Takifugu flavidus]|uniref:Mitochondrial S-adenosylmethionine carrier protein n=1 Tax=Takifugu flavidus TaxID=433684 RepID=A0A5C6N7M9_9TELE|nr:S-adenosylmethionine mitochondrial carrier protein [Takifugu flavidus]